VALLLGASPAIAAIATWSAPVDLSATLQTADNPQVTVDSTGRATAVWSRYNGANNVIQSSTSVSGGAWSAPVDVSATLQDAYNPQVTVDSTGRATAVWQRLNGTKSIIQSSTSVNGGAWSTPVDLSATLRDAYSPQVTVDSTGRATAVWARSNGTKYIIQSSTSLNGAAWSTPVDLSATLQDASNPQVTVDSTGRATAVWYRYNGTKNIVQSSTSVSGGAWSAPVDLSATLQHAYNPQVTVDSTGRATAVWYRSNGANNIIQSSTSVSGGAWSAPVDLSATLQSAFIPQVTVDSTGRATAIWYRSDGANNIIQSSTSVSGGAWSAPVDLSATLQDAYNAQVTVDSTGRATAVWARSNGANDIIQSSTSVSGGAWSAPVDLSATLQNAYNPQVTVDSTGRATAIWYRSNGANSIIQSSSAYDPPAAGSAGAALAATGVDTMLPLGVASVLLLAGTAIVVVRRRTRNT
jgi:hypothetical protein